MLAFRWETGARRYELTLEHDLLGDLLLRRAWSGMANKHSTGKMQVFLGEQAAMHEDEKVCIGAGRMATTWCALIICDATG